LYLCAKAAGSKTILELGTAAGISGCYLASAPSCRRFITVEGSAERARLAQAHLRQVVGCFELITASFDAALDRLLPGLRDGIDLVFIDGSKKKGENLRLFDRLSAQLNPGSVILFDDIHWSTDLWKDWNDLGQRVGLTHAIGAGRFGVCVWDGRGARPRTDTLYGIAGLDLYGVKQRLSRWRSR
jgi:predicted O-methyltransferase YrrM